MNTCKFVVVCTFGAGSSLMLRLNVEAALKEIGAQNCTVEVSDMGNCKSKEDETTAYLCSIVLEPNLRQQIAEKPVVGIKNFYSKDELKSALMPFVS